MWKIRFFLALLIVTIMGGLAVPPATADDPVQQKASSRWWGHDFVFCFMTDDNNGCNTGWAEKALEMDFRFTMAVNPYKMGWGLKLTGEQCGTFAALGFEIANHSLSHAHYGMVRCVDPLEPPDCDPQFGNLRAYFSTEGSFASWLEAEPFFLAEIHPCSTAAAIPSLDCTDIKTFAYPNAGFSAAIIDSLISMGYIGARNGHYLNYFAHSGGDFTVPAANSWDGGISLYRIPTIGSANPYFGNHSAIPPVHFTYEEFLAATTPVVQDFVASGGMMVLSPHHFGDDDTCHSTDWGYGDGGVTPQDMEWIVDLVRANNGIVKPIGEAIAYYRERSEMTVVDNDYVWLFNASGVPVANREVHLYPNIPNPFNPSTTIRFEIPREGNVRLSVFDMRGRRVAQLLSGHRSAGEHLSVWDGRTSEGGVAPAGVYFVRLVTNHGQQTRKIVMAK